jgi:hypothetical protein
LTQLPTRQEARELEEAKTAAERERDTHAEQLTRVSAERIDEQRRHEEEVHMLLLDNKG